MRNDRIAGLAAVIFLAFPFAIQAQDLIGGNGSVDVDTSGLPVYAYAVGNANSPTVNGVSFLSAVEDANHNYQDNNVLIHNVTSSSVFGVPASVTPGSAYATLVGSGGYSAGKGNDITIKLNVRTGRNYELEFWANDTRSDRSPESEAITDPHFGGPSCLGSTVRWAPTAALGACMCRNILPPADPRRSSTSAPTPTKPSPQPSSWSPHFSYAMSRRLQNRPRQ